MGFIGDLVKLILISWVLFWILAMIWFAVTGQTALALLFLIGLVTPLSFITYDYRHYRKK
jgi:hypothetical protein